MVMKIFIRSKPLELSPPYPPAHKSLWAERWEILAESGTLAICLEKVHNFSKKEASMSDLLLESRARRQRLLIKKEVRR